MSKGKKDPHTIKMMLMTLAAVCGTVAVILTAFFFFEQKQSRPASKRKH